MKNKNINNIDDNFSSRQRREERKKIREHRQEEINKKQAGGICGRIKAKDLLKLDPSVIEGIGEAIEFDLVLSRDNDGDGNYVNAIPRIHDKWTDGLNMGDISSTPGLEEYFGEGRRNRGMEKFEHDVLCELIKMADDMDRSEEEELAAEIDEVISSIFPGMDDEDSMDITVVDLSDNHSKENKCMCGKDKVDVDMGVVDKELEEFWK